METNRTMMQFFEWYLPNDGFWWKRCAAKAQNLAGLGITDIWLPPAYKCTSQDDVGYSIYDLYDLGEFDQKGTVRTKYGTKEEYIEAVKALHDEGILVYADIVLNHRMGGDKLEKVRAVPVSPENRYQPVGDEQTVSVWSEFTFPGRNNKYSSFKWNHTHFTGTDWDEASKESGKIYRFTGKNWESDTDPEFGSFDYLMGMNVDMENPEVSDELRRWLEWYLKETNVDALRLDAVKHISFSFYRDFLKTIRKDSGRAYPAVGEYWSGDLDKLLYYLDSVENTMSLFDVALHFNFYNASKSGSDYDMSNILSRTLVSERPANAVTFVDNHDTQFGQSLQSFVEDWFKQLAYTIILLKKDGLPCVFYADYYGNPAHNRPMVPNLGKLIKLRHLYSYGDQTDYFDDNHIVGWVRSGDDRHPDSGFAVLLSNADGGSKKMFIGKDRTGTKYYDALSNSPDPVIVDEDGYGLFTVGEKSVSVWVLEGALEELTVNE
ncbi:MAG: alpha-amylase [Mogibacterium sp.]|nr:alpha-amylase [Mogibacterium sp.]